MENENLIFALSLFKTQLQDSLTMIGKAILKEVSEELETLDDYEKLEKVKKLMENPFIKIDAMCKSLNEEYKAFRDSPEIKEHIQLLMEEIKTNPNLVDDMLSMTPEEVSEVLSKIKDKDDNDGNLQ
jgi:hypothetical protein